MKHLLLILMAVSLGQLAAAEPPPRPPGERQGPAFDRHRQDRTPAALIGKPATYKGQDGPQIGVNFIRFYWSEPRTEGLDKSIPYYQPDWIFKDFKTAGVNAFRQFVKADLLWNVVEQEANQWDWEAADMVLKNGDFISIPTLFNMQYASATPHWTKDPTRFQKTIGPDAAKYLETVVKRYAPFVKYWELGNEMDHWRAVNPGDTAPGKERLPDSVPADGFSPREQGVFLAQAAAIIRRNDPDAVIVMPGMSSLSDYELDIWLPGVIEGGGKDWFDVVNYHYYSTWERFPLLRPKLTETMKRLGIAGKPVWQTETGSTSSPDLTIRTNYPNSPESQAADVFRRIVQGFGHGDSLVLWHCYISSKDNTHNAWRCYGLRDDHGNATLAYYAFLLLATELTPFGSVDLVAADPRGRSIYRFTTRAGAAKYVTWGNGTFTVPKGISRFASVVPTTSGAFAWQETQPGRSITLSSTPILLK